MCTMPRVRSGSVLTLLTCLVVLAGLAACSSPAPATSPAPTGSAGPAASGAAGATGAEPGSPRGAAAGPAGGPAPASPADAALRLQALLGQHHVLAADLMRGRLRNDEDFAQAANAAVGQNTDELAAGGRRRWAASSRRPGSRRCGASTSRRCSTTRAAWRRTTPPCATRPGPRWTASAPTAPSSSPRRRGPADPGGGAHRAGHARRSPDAAGRRLRRGRLRAGQHALPRGLPARLRPRERRWPPTLLPPDQAAELNTPAWKLRSEMTRLLGEHVGLALGHAARRRHQRPGLPGDGRVAQRQHQPTSPRP